MPDLQNLLDQIDRLDQEATKGPWIIDSIESGEHALFVEEDNPGYGHLGAASSTVASFLLAKNADFIALSRTALPVLARVVQTVIDSCEETIRDVNRQYSPDERDHGKHFHADMILDHIQDALEATGVV